MKKIIYIMGLGRSGSTLLDILLGNGENIFSVGELNRYWVRKGKPGYWVRFKDSPTFLFWDKIKNQLGEKLSADIDFDRIKRLIRSFEYHSTFFKFKSKTSAEEYQRLVLTLYETIFENIQDSTIVDSSKYPARAIRIAKIVPYQTVFIYLKRDPRGVIKSFSRTGIKQPSKSWLKANLYYLFASLLCEFVAYKLKKRYKLVEIKYENLIDDPIGTLTLIQNELEIDLNPVIGKIRTDEPLTVGKLFEGNRIREKATLKLETQLPTYPNDIKNFLTRLINLIVYK